MTNNINKKPVILLVEDDNILTKMYQTKFTMEGFDVLIASNGEEGLKTATEKEVDFIILDIMMPQLSGIDLLTELRKNPKGKGIPVIILTNLSEKSEEEKARSLGIEDYLIKANLTPEEVVLKIKKFLGR